MKKRLLMICLACLMAVSATACGNSNDDSSESEKTKSNTSSVPQSDESSEEAAESKDEPAPADSSESETETDQSESETDESEPETEPANDEKYAYYDLLDAEYQKYGIWSHYENYVAADGYVLIGDGNSLNVLEKGANGHQPYLVIKEDGSYIDLWELDIFKEYSDYLRPAYRNGYLYEMYWSNDESKYYATINMVGNVVRNVELGSGRFDLMAISGDGDAIIAHDKKNYILKDDSDTLIEMPNPTIEGEHGLTVELSDLSFKNVFYNSKIYVSASDPNGNLHGFYLECDDLSWHECEYIDSTDVNYIIGRYLFLSDDYGHYSSKVYDLETDTFVFDIPVMAAVTYRGGDSNIVYSGTQYEEARYPSDIKDFKDRETIKALTEESFGRNAPPYGLMMSKTHYLYIDSYGYFIRSFEKGAEDEKTVILIDNQ